jgi:hypothetical protein
MTKAAIAVKSRRFCTMCGILTFERPARKGERRNSSFIIPQGLLSHMEAHFLMRQT